MILNIELFITWVKKNKIKTFFVVMGFFLAPLIVVHVLFKWNTGCDFISSEWSAGDCIEYIAGFETFIGTIVLGLVAVWQTEKSNKTNDKLLNLTIESERISVLPFLSFNSYIPKYEGNKDIIKILLKEINKKNNAENHDASEPIPIEDNPKRIDMFLKEMNFTISKDIINLSSELNDEQKEKIKYNFGIKMSKGGATLCSPDYYYKKIYIENCGKGSVINLKCRLYKIGHEEDENFDVYSIPFTVPLQKFFDLGLYFDLTEKMQGDFRLVFTYQDIYMNSYSQCIPLEIDEESFTIDFYQSQQRESR